MTAHDHTERVPGCFRCDLSEDEMKTEPTPKRKRSDKRQMTKLLAVRLTEPEMDAVVAAAARAGLSRSAYIRHALMRTTPKCSTCEDTGSVAVAGERYFGNSITVGAGAMLQPCPNGCHSPIRNGCTS